MKPAVGAESPTVNPGFPAWSWGPWKAAVLNVLLVVLFLRDSFISMAGQWYSSTTYSYGFLIVPIVLFLLWRDRHQIASVELRPALIPVVFMLPAGVLWVIGVILNVDGLHHLAAVVLLVLGIWSGVGHAAARRMAFPLAYLLFMVPFGEIMVPYLMRLTADVAVLGVQWSGVPVFQDGFLFSLPSGDFEVIKACSGIRFLMTTLAAGAVFAYVAYTSPSRRLLFMIACCIVPIAANLLRAYGVVMIAHLSDLRFSAGGDHVLAGTVFFGAVLITMFVVGARFSEARIENGGGLVEASGDRKTVSAHGYGQVVTIVLVAGLLGLASMLPAAAGARLKSLAVIELPVLLAYLPGWRGPDTDAVNWRPDFSGAVRDELVSYESGGTRVAVYVAAYGAQEPGAELVSAVNTVYNPDTWRVVTTGGGRLHVGTTTVPYIETTLRDQHGQGRVVWHWYSVHGSFVTSSLSVKLLELRALLEGKRMVAGAIVLSVESHSGDADARSDLAHFLDALCRSPGSGSSFSDCDPDSGTRPAL